MKRIALLLLFIISNIWAAEVSTYLYGKLQTPQEIKEKLSQNALEAIGEYDAMGDPNYHVIVYTSRELKAMGSKENRGFAAVQKILIDKKDGKLVFTNPEYFERAFMQGDLYESKVKIVANKLKFAFGTLEKSPESLDEGDLKGYHFMFAMPYYEDMIDVAQGDSLDATLEANAKSKIVFKLPLGKSTLYGVKMDTAKGEKSFIPAISQEKNSAFLPYMVLISGNKAKILHAKYYLAVSLPNLSMGQFMTISDAPGNIEDYFKSLFKK